LGSCEERVIKTNTTTIAVLENFWADFDAVKAELEKLPIAPTAYNDQDMEDYRSAWVSTILVKNCPSKSRWIPKSCGCSQETRLFSQLYVQKSTSTGTVLAQIA